MRKILQGGAVFLLAIQLIASCSKPGCAGDAGGVIAQVRSAPAFNQVNIRDNIHLVLTQDTVERIRVQAPEHILPNISSDVKDGILYLRNSTSCKWLREPGDAISVFVSVKDLIRVIYNGSGNVTSTNTIKADAITFTTDEGAGNIDISLDAKRTYVYIFNDNTDMIFTGKSDSCYAYTGERGTIDFRNFIVQHQKVGYGSIRDGYVHATESLDVLMYFKGTLYYRGSPQRVKTEYFSPGRVLPAP